MDHVVRELHRRKGQILLPEERAGASLFPFP